MYMMFMRRGKITDVLNALSPLLEMTPWISIGVDPIRLGMTQNFVEPGKDLIFKSMGAYDYWSTEKVVQQSFCRKFRPKI